MKKKKVINHEAVRLCKMYLTEDSKLTPTELVRDLKIIHGINYSWKAANALATRFRRNKKKNEKVEPLGKNSKTKTFKIDKGSGDEFSVTWSFDSDSISNMILDLKRISSKLGGVEEVKKILTLIS